MTQSICFVIMPFGAKTDTAGRSIDFDAVYEKILAPAIADVGLLAIRADKEMSSGLIHKAMFERLLLSDYAIADLTLLNANVYYELGVRHAARPQTTVLISAEASRLPFDVGPLAALPYSLDGRGRPNRAKADRAALAEKLEYCKSHPSPDSPLFTLIEGFVAPQVAHDKTDIFRREVNNAEAFTRKLNDAKNENVKSLDVLRADLGDITAREPNIIGDLLLAYRGVNAWDRMIDLYGAMDAVLARSAWAREQYAFALNRSGRGLDAERVLGDLIGERGPSSETYGLLGRVYKDRWRTAKEANDEIDAMGALDKAIEAYRKGFEADWRDAFPGINAATLMEIREPGSPDVKALVPVIRYAVERKIARGAVDYWDYATLLELAVLERDSNRASRELAAAWAERHKMDKWSPESTAANLNDIAEARETRGEDVSSLRKIVERLTRQTSS